MAKLYFYYSAMNAGKSTTLIQSSYNYQERGMKTIQFTSKLDITRGHGLINSRIGLTEEALLLDEKSEIFSVVQQENQAGSVHCVFVDEAQFLTREQVYQLSDVVDYLNIPVLCYGIRTDFQGKLFQGSKYLLAWADVLEELKTICFCGRKASFVLRINEKNQVITEGEQIDVGGNEKYISVCRYHFKEQQTS